MFQSQRSYLSLHLLSPVTWLYDQRYLRLFILLQNPYRPRYIMTILQAELFEATKRSCSERQKLSYRVVMMMSVLGGYLINLGTGSSLVTRHNHITAPPVSARISILSANPGRREDRVQDIEHAVERRKWMYWSGCQWQRSLS